MLPLSPEVIKHNSEIKDKLPLNVLETIHSLNDINPRIYPPFKGCGIKYQYYNKFVDSAYSIFSLAVGSKQYDGVIIISRIRTGGTDKLLKSYLNVISNLLKLNILIICEDSTESAWTGEFENMAEVVYLDKIFDSNIPQPYKIAAINYYLIQMNPKFVWAFNSRLAYILICTYGEVLHKHMDLWLVTFAHWIHEVSYREFGMIHDYLPKCINYIKYIISDNSVFIDKLSCQYNLSSEKLIHIPSPNSLKPISYEKKLKRENIKILWASGIEWNKGVNILTDIAIELKNKGVRASIDVYGTPKNNNGYKLLDSLKKKAGKLNNLEFKGEFSNFNHLDPQSYDLFLFTSMIEGMPNILLEAAENQMFIISSDVGGVTDLVKHDITGLLVENSLNSDEYIDRIISFMNMDEENFNHIRKNMVENYNRLYTSKVAQEIFDEIIE